MKTPDPAWGGKKRRKMNKECQLHNRGEGVLKPTVSEREREGESHHIRKEKHTHSKSFSHPTS